MPYPYKSIRDWVNEEEQLGNVLRIKTPTKCGDYNNIVDIGNNIPGKIPETETRAVVRYLHSLRGKPIGIFENPVNNRPDIPVIVNIWPSRERTYRGMGLKDNNELAKKLESAQANRIKPVVVSKEKALCKEVIITEEKVDLRKDIPRCWVEFNRLLWSGCNGTVIIYDPETRTHNLGKLRAGQFEWEDSDPNKPCPEEKVKNHMFATVIWSGHAQSDTGRFYAEHRSKNQPMPGAYAFLTPTDINFIGAMRGLQWPENGDEYDIVGGFRGEPVEVVESETIPGLMVPAQAEWIVEGEFLPEDMTTPPFAEDVYTGYMMGGMRWVVFKVKCITHRKKPWWESSFSSSGLHGHEGTHAALNVTTHEADTINYLRRLGFKVKDAVVTSAERGVQVIQMEVDGADKPRAGYGLLAAMALLSRIRPQATPKYTIVVGPDIDPYDLTDVMWALATRSMPVSDSILIEKGTPSELDPGSYALSGTQRYYGTMNEHILIDALIKVPERYEEYPPRSDPAEWEKEAIERIKKKLG